MKLKKMLAFKRGILIINEPIVNNDTNITDFGVLSLRKKREY